MLEDKNRIFKNLYNDLGADLNSAILRGDWSNTKEILSKNQMPDTSLWVVKVSATIAKYKVSKSAKRKRQWSSLMNVII